MVISIGFPREQQNQVLKERKRLTVISSWFLGLETV